MPTAAGGGHNNNPRAATPSSSFMVSVQRKKPPQFNRDADEELLAAAADAQRKYEAELSSMTSGSHSAKHYNAHASFTQVNEHRAAASQWRSNAAARKQHEARQMDRYLHSFVPTGEAHPGAIVREQRRAQAGAVNSIISDGDNNGGMMMSRQQHSISSSSSIAANVAQRDAQKETFQHDIASFEDKLSRLRRDQRKKDEDKHKLGSETSKAQQQQQQQQQAVSSSTKTKTKTTSSSDCAPFALPKVLQMLFRILLSRSLSATEALRAVGFPELRSRLSAAAEGGMVKRHAFEAIFLECLRTDRERLEHAAVVDCFLLDAGGDAELAFVLIALQVLLGIASAADVMRYCFYLLDTSSRVPRYLTRLELEALLREAESAAAANPASKDDTEYTSMRGAVLQILDTSSDLFDGKGRMPLSTFLDKLRSAMNDASQDAISISAAADKNKRKKSQQQQQQLDGLASRHDLFHHSTSRRIVLQTAPDELVKEC